MSDVDTTEVQMYLRGAKDAAVQARRRNTRAQDLWDACTRVTSAASGMPSGGGSTKEDKLVLYCDACREELDALWEERVRQKEIADFIDLIPKAPERYILQFRYLDYMTWPQTIAALESVGIYYTDRYIRMLHKMALETAAKIYAERNSKE